MGDSCPKFIQHFCDTSNDCAVKVTVAESDFHAFHLISSRYGLGIAFLEMNGSTCGFCTFAFQLHAKLLARRQSQLR